MATVLSVKERAVRRHKIAPKGERSYLKKYYVYVDEKTIDPQDIRKHPLVPQMFSTYPTDPGAIVQSVDIDQDEDYPNRYNMDVEFKSIVGDAKGEQDDQDVPPLLRPTIISFPPAQSYREVVSHDVNGQPIVTKANEPIEGIEREFKLPMIRMERWRAVYNATNILAYGSGAVNSDAWFGFPPYTVKLESISYSPELVEGATYWKEITEFAVKSKFKSSAEGGAQIGWRARLLNAGYKQQLAIYTVHIRDPNSGQEVSKPWPLDALGVALPSPVVAADFTWLYFDLLPALPFSALNLP